MRISDTEYLQVWQHVQQWGTEPRRRLADQIHQSLICDHPGSDGEWTEAKNARRCQLIDKDIQEALTEADRQELATLTQQLRAYRRRVAPIPIDGARRLHEQLLEKKRQQESAREET
jgi:hypothetical protein